MAAAPAQIESRSTTGDPEALQFQRLERVRQRRVRRRYRLFIAATLAITLAGAGVMGFIAIRRTSLEHPGSSSSRPSAPVEMVKPAVAAPAVTVTAPSPPLVDASQPAGADTVKRREAQPPRIHADTDRGPRAVAPLRDDPHDTEAVDPAAAIDWLLKRGGRDTTPNDREEKRQ
jgi:hypothetical protein